MGPKYEWILHVKAVNSLYNRAIITEFDSVRDGTLSFGWNLILRAKLNNLIIFMKNFETGKWTQSTDWKKHKLKHANFNTLVIK